MTEGTGTTPGNETSSSRGDGASLRLTLVSRSFMLVAAFGLVSGCEAEPLPAVESGPEVAETFPRFATSSIRVKTATVQSGRIGALADVPGVIRPFRTATVSVERAARVVRRHVEPGAVVVEGAPLVTLDRTLAEISAEEDRSILGAREVDLKEAQLDLIRGDALAGKGAMSERQHEALRFAVARAKSAREVAAAALRRSKRALVESVVRAPFDGTVEEIRVHVGDYLVSGNPVAVVADFSRVRLRAGVTASEAVKLRAGQEATVSITSLGGEAKKAVLHSVGRMASDETGTYSVELWLDNEDGRLRDGVVGYLHFAALDEEEGALVPRAALLRRDGGLALFVVEGNPGSLRASARTIRVGRQSGELVHVVAGVEAGEQVVVDGVFALTDGAPITLEGSTDRSTSPDSESSSQ